MSEKIEESVNQKHLRVVNQIAEIFEKEFDDCDDIYFVVRTLKNIFIWDSEESRDEWLYRKAIDRYMKEVDTGWFKRHYGFIK